MIVRRYLKSNVRICFFPDWSFGTVERAGGYISTCMYERAGLSGHAV